MKTNELTGAALNWAVAEAEGFFKNDMASIRDGKVDVFYFDGYAPSVDWALGGAIIQRERISLLDQGGDCWLAICGWTEMFGDTHLIAAMRSYVGSKLGNEVQIPEEISK
jgi:hypothetical protein